MITRGQARVASHVARPSISRVPLQILTAWLVLSLLLVLLAGLATPRAAAAQTDAADPDPVFLDLSVSVGSFQTRRDTDARSGSPLASDEPVSIELDIAGEPMSLSNTSPRTVMLAAGEPATLRLVDAGPDHVLTAITCREQDGLVPEPMSFDLGTGSVTLGAPTGELGCEFRLDDAALAGRITLAVESMSDDPAAAVDFLVDTDAGIIEPVRVTPDGPRTFPVRPIPAEQRMDPDFLPRFTIHLLEPAPDYELAAFRCLDRHGQALEMHEPDVFVPVYPGNVPPRDVAVSIQPGGEATCTASVVRTDDLLGAATVRVLTRPLLIDAVHALDTTFELDIDGETVQLAAAEPYLVQPAAAADQTTIELLDPGPDHELRAIECVRRDGGDPTPYMPDVATRNVTVGLAADDTVDCIYRLIGPAMQSDPPGEAAHVIALVLTEPPFSEGTVDVEMAGETVTLGHGDYATDDDADPHRYPLVVRLGSDFELASLECVDLGGDPATLIEGDVPGAVVLDPADATTTCTITVRPRLATVRVAVASDPPDAEVTFTVEMQGEPVELMPGDLATDDTARADLYRLTLLPASGFRLLDIECHDIEGERRPAEITFENQSVAFAPGIGADVTCTFVVQGETAIGDGSSGRSGSGEPGDDVTTERSGEPSTDPADVLAPKPGVWRSVNAKSAIVCGAFSTTLPKVVDKGPIQVKKGGRRIVAPVEGGKVVLDQVEGKPGRYRGTVKESSLNVPMMYDVKVLDAEHMKGTLRATFEQGGTKCTVERDFDSRWVRP